MDCVLRDSFVVGKKKHQCYLCGKTIDKGVKHRLHVRVIDGTISSTRYHLICDKVTVLDGWDAIDWETIVDHAEFRNRLSELFEEES